MDKNAAKRLGLRTRKGVLDVTWCPLPRRMLELLVRIADRELGVSPDSHRKATALCPGHE